MTFLNPPKFITRSLIGAVGLSAIAFLGFPESAKAQMCTSSGSSLPPVDCAYAAQQHLQYPNGIDFSNPFHSRFRDIKFTGDEPMNIGDMQTEMFNSDVDMVVTLPDGRKLDLKGIPAAVTTKITLINIETLNDGLVKKTFDNEMLQLDLLGLPDGLMFREDPDTASTGMTMVTELANGKFEIMSFFDIYGQISLDGGQNWIDPIAPGRVDAVDLPSVPEPSTTLGLLLFGLGSVAGLKRKGNSLE
ncbi:PEP-CTERM sorting domain-containing protein [Crocosphaera sp. XPORK-15E]|uniref:PEP-CTERM sorting domain-containing protein n=1 Tax=Crocosphaera sp. XPORK-15E TaxID=3110247 RepID=UPI002B2177B1|nr:PEP-CTERM sorting domain-containing protein [Crocosphaera sp. XPORK-15E]MEA5532430.1 PEP-CTERM sorting domain-containing protein [Crocosphaera sp. XPORK-15E]